mmetsp:Transcript_19960/g.48126  ORF Transcript_19960/g.48126 Transcript_19960/m.48126 type:complete len:314 (+) Transcript_19960:3150-4091(+)
MLPSCLASSSRRATTSSSLRRSTATSSSQWWPQTPSRTRRTLLARRPLALRACRAPSPPAAPLFSTLLQTRAQTSTRPAHTTSRLSLAAASASGVRWLPPPTGLPKTTSPPPSPCRGQRPTTLTSSDARSPTARRYTTSPKCAPRPPSRSRLLAPSAVLLCARVPTETPSSSRRRATRAPARAGTPTPTARRPPRVTSTRTRTSRTTSLAARRSRVPRLTSTMSTCSLSSPAGRGAGRGASPRPTLATTFCCRWPPGGPSCPTPLHATQSTAPSKPTPSTRAPAPPSPRLSRRSARPPSCPLRASSPSAAATR